MDEYGNSWKFDNVWTKDYIPQIKGDKLSTHGFDRHHFLFDNYKQKQIQLAEKTLEKILQGKEIQKDLKSFKTIELFTNNEL